MINEIEQLEQRIAKHCQSVMRYDETLFNLGVELGRLLEKNGIHSHRPSIFVEFETKNDVDRKKAKQTERIDKVISFLIKNAVAQQIEERGSFCFNHNASSYNCEKLDENIVEKYCVQITNTTQREHGGSFEAEFLLSGQVADILNQYGISLRVRADVDNSTGDEHETIYDADDVDKIFGISLFFNAYTTNLDEIQLSAIADELEKIQVAISLALIKIR